MRQIYLLLVPFFALSVTGDDKCRLVVSKNMVCKDASEQDLPSKPQPNIEWLSLVKSKVPRLRHSMLKNFPQLTDLHAEGVGVESVDNDAFKGLARLNWIDLASNKIKTIHVDLVKHLAVDHFNISHNKGLAIPERKPLLIADKLKWLDLQGCEIHQVYTETFEKLPSLRDLSLARNHLKTLPDNIFKQNRGLLSFDITGNDIKTLNANIFAGLRTMVVRFEENPWECDCQLAPLLTWSKRNVVKGDVRCAKPKNTKWKDVADPCKPLK